MVFAGRNRLRKGLTVVLVLGGLELLAFGLARLLIVRSPLSHADAIVVLSGSSVYQERVRWAVQLYKQGVAPKIILTNDNHQGGWSNVLERNQFFYERARDQLFALGVPQDDVVVLLQPVGGTHEEALLLKSYCEEHKLRSLVIVTSAYHSRRARWTFQRVVGAQGIEVGIDPAGNENQPAATWWLHLSGWKSVPPEYVKLLYYWIAF